MKVLLTIIYLLLTTGGMVLMKLGGNSLVLSFKNGFMFKMGYLTMLGFIVYLLSFILWQRLLVAFDLSYIVPITTGISQIIILIVGYFIFKESINVFNIIGVLLIISGIMLVVLKK